MMDSFLKEFVMELFLDNDSVSTMNKLVVTMANVINENSENISMINQTVSRELNEGKSIDQAHSNSLTGHIENFYENSLRNCTDELYFQRMKMRRSTVQALITFLSEFVRPSTNITLDKKVHVFLWFLNTHISLSEIGSLFGLKKSSVTYIISDIAMALSEQRYQFITWPSLEEQNVTRLKVSTQCKFPNCVGFIDACRFKVGTKRIRGKSNTVLLQAVCDESFLFINIHIGEIGEIRKSRVFKDSQLSQELKNFIEFENHLLGDSDYKLRKNLITPFTSHELLTDEEMKFNNIHWKSRIYISHAFELLKERFRRLHCIEIRETETAYAVITSACVLHNFILLHEGGPELKEESVTYSDPCEVDTSIVTTAEEKRQFLCNYINYINDTTF